MEWGETIHYMKSKTSVVREDYSQNDEEPFVTVNHIDGWVQDCSLSIANAPEILQSCTKSSIYIYITLQWHHSEQNGKSAISRLFTQPLIQSADQRKNQSSAPLAFVRNPPVTGEFPTQRASNAENVSIWWHHHGYQNTKYRILLTCNLNYLVSRSIWHLKP